MKRYLRILLSTILILSLIADSGFFTVASYAETNSNIRYNLQLHSICRDPLGLKIEDNVIVAPQETYELLAKPSKYYVVTDWSMNSSGENCELIWDKDDPCRAIFANTNSGDSGKTVTKNIDINVIVKRVLNITVKDQSYIYDGLPHGESDPVYKDPGVINTKIEVYGLWDKDEVASITLTGQAEDPGEYEIELTSILIKEGDKNVTNEYYINIVPGKLTIAEEEPITGYTIRFDANGGSNKMGPFTVESQEYELPPCEFVPPEDKVFKCWEVNGEEHDEGDNITLSEDKDTVVKALWKDAPVESYTVKFDANGGSSNMGPFTVGSREYELPPCEFVPPEGKVFKCWEVNGEEHDEGDKVTLTENEDTVVKALWKGAPKPRKEKKEKEEAKEEPLLFRDVQKTDYFYDAVKWAWEKGITAGVAEDLFGPDLECTRAQFITLLYGAAGSPEVSGEMPFRDVPEDLYFYKPVLWAYQNGITAGNSDGTFGSAQTVTRAQAVTMFYGIKDRPEAGGDMPFNDVPEDAYYYRSVLWAYGQGITAGTGDGAFSPEDPCTRAQIVTMLCQLLAE